MGKGYLKPCSDKWRNHMREVFPTPVLAWGRYHYFEFISNRNLSVIIWFNIGIKCLSIIRIKWVLVWVQNWIVSILACCNLWPKHMVMFVLHWASKEWNGCLSNLLFLPHSSLGLEATVLKSSLPTPLCYCLSSQRNPGISQIPPLFPLEWLGPIFLSPLLQVSQTTHCHSHTETPRVEQDTSSVAQNVVNTEFRIETLFLRVSSYWVLKTSRDRDFTASLGILFLCCHWISWCSFLSVFFQHAYVQWKRSPAPEHTNFLTTVCCHLQNWKSCTLVPPPGHR